MKIRLVVSGACPFCLEAEKVWRGVATEHGLEFAVLDIAQPEIAEQMKHLNLQTVPALLIDGVLRAVGVQSRAEALMLVQPVAEADDLSCALAHKKPDNVSAHELMQRMGISFSTDNRWFIISAQVYLMLAGLGLLINGSFLGDNAARPAFLHLFTLGFMLFLIYGLGSHMLPRFTGNPIREGAWPWLQMGLAHAGVAGYFVGYLAGSHALIIFGAIQAWLALLIFATRVWPVLWPNLAIKNGPPLFP